jgi:hypothetical protein
MGWAERVTRMVGCKMHKHTLLMESSDGCCEHGKEHFCSMRAGNFSTSYATVSFPRSSDSCAMRLEMSLTRPWRPIPVPPEGGVTHCRGGKPTNKASGWPHTSRLAGRLYLRLRRQTGTCIANLAGYWASDKSAVTVSSLSLSFPRRFARKSASRNVWVHTREAFSPLNQLTQNYTALFVPSVYVSYLLVIVGVMADMTSWPRKYFITRKRLGLLTCSDLRVSLLLLLLASGAFFLICS